MGVELLKIKEILGHFIEHTEEHAQEFESLADKARREKEGEELANALILASQKLREAVEVLRPFV